MKISKMQLAIIIAACILLLIIVFVLSKPRSQVTAPKSTNQNKTQEMPPQRSRYELPSQEEKTELSSQWKPLLTKSKGPLSAKTLDKVKEAPAPEPEYNSVSAEASAQEECANQGKLLPPDTIEDMRNRGIIVY